MEAGHRSMSWESAWSGRPLGEGVRPAGGALCARHSPGQLLWACCKWGGRSSEPTRPAPAFTLVSLILALGADSAWTDRQAERNMGRARRVGRGCHVEGLGQGSGDQEACPPSCLSSSEGQRPSPGQPSPPGAARETHFPLSSTGTLTQPRLSPGLEAVVTVL